MKLSLSFLALSLVSAVLGAPYDLDKRQGDSGSGYTTIPVPSGSVFRKDYKVSGHNVPVLFSNDSASSITRAMIVPPGKGRNCWSYWSTMKSTLNSAVSKGLITAKEVAIAAPCFMAPIDQRAGAVDASTLVWGVVDWDWGADSVAPSGAVVSSYSVLDELIAYYMDSANFPNLKTVVVAGHSMGAQMVQRYATLHKAGSLEGQGKALHFWIGNPGSVAWLVSDRPTPNAACSNVDGWKYGLNGSFVSYASDANTLGRTGMVERYRARNVHHLWGTADTGVGDNTCQAVTQGKTRIQIGRNFDAMLRAGGLSATNTIDYIDGVAHDGAKMFGSTAGLNRLFKS